LFLFLTKERRELQQVMAIDLVQVDLPAGFGEIVQSGGVSGQGLWLLWELSFFQELGDCGCVSAPVIKGAILDGIGRSQ
jgi:hypothetical protein